MALIWRNSAPNAPGSEERLSTANSMLSTMPKRRQHQAGAHPCIPWLRLIPLGRLLRLADRKLTDPAPEVAFAGPPGLQAADHPVALRFGHGQNAARLPLADPGLQRADAVIAKARQGRAQLGHGRIRLGIASAVRHQVDIDATRPDLCLAEPAQLGQGCGLRVAVRQAIAGKAAGPRRPVDHHAACIGDADRRLGQLGGPPVAVARLHRDPSGARLGQAVHRTGKAVSTGLAAGRDLIGVQAHASSPAGMST